MRWSVFAIFTFVALVLDVGLRTLWSLPVAGNVAPDLLLIVAVYVAMSAPPMQVAWATLVLGLLSDLRPIAVSESGGDLLLLGPATLGFVVGGYAALQLRGYLFRQSPLSIAVMVMGAGLFVHLTTVALVTLRGVVTLGPLFNQPLTDPAVGWHASDQLVGRFIELLYTAAVALPLGWALLKTDPWWAFHPAKSAGKRR